MTQTAKMGAPIVPEQERTYTRGVGTDRLVVVVPVDSRGMVLVSAELLDQLLRDLGLTWDPEAPAFPPAVHTYGGTAERMAGPGYPRGWIPG